MTRISQIRYMRFRWQRAAISSVRRMRSILAIFPACLTRHCALLSPVYPDCVQSSTAHGFRLVCGTNQHPRSIRRLTHLSGLNLWFISRSSQAPLWAYPSPWRHGAALLWFHHPPGLGFQREISRAAYARLRPKCRRDFPLDPPQKARLGLGSRALREASPGVP
jgi:hypothetical protein